jgi:hypothetical protein
MTTTNSVISQIALYMTGSTDSAYENCSWASIDNFKDRQFNEMFVKSFKMLTQGTGPWTANGIQLKDESQT